MVVLLDKVSFENVGKIKIIAAQSDSSLEIDVAIYVTSEPVLFFTGQLSSVV